MDDLTNQRADSRARYLATQMVILTAVGQAMGLAMAKPILVGWNDISRWCTVWSLLERGTYAIDECPWQGRTQDKVFKPIPGRAASGEVQASRRFYSSKPPMLPTLIAGLIYPWRMAVGVPLEAEVRVAHGSAIPAYVLYFRPVVVLLNILPFGIFLAFYVRLLDRYAASDWTWFVCLFTAAWGTQLLAFTDSLNNHLTASFSAFFSSYAILSIRERQGSDRRLFAIAGFFGALAACNELPAALYGAALFVWVLVEDRRKALLYFIPAAAIPCLAFLATQYLAMGTLVPAYSRPDWYHYEGSYWNDPQGADALLEDKSVYIFHMTLGHHGFFSLTPVFLFSAYAIVRGLRERVGPLSGFAWMTGGLSVAMLAFYGWRTNNYGGPSQALRWFLWLFPLWLILLPWGLDAARGRPGVRRLAMVALFLSVFSVAYALQGSWSRPWLQRLLTIFNLCNEY